MNKIYTYFNYNWLKIIKKNIKNNEKIKKPNPKIDQLVLKKEINSVIFIIINLLVTYNGLKEIYKINYKNNIFIHIFKDNITTSIIWFIILTILPITTSLMTRKKIKKKNYLILELLYLISNIFNIIIFIYFILTIITNIYLGIIGIINTIIMIIININIIIEIIENYLKE